MSEFCYNVLALIPTSSDFGVSNAVEIFIKNGYSASIATSPSGKSSGFQVIPYENWKIVAWLEDGNDTAVENQETIEVFGNPPNVTTDKPIKCDRRLSVWSDDDADMLNAHLFEEYINFLKEKFGLYIFDSVQGIWR